MPTLFDISLVTFNSATPLALLLKDLAALDATGHLGRILVADNASTDNTLELLAGCPLQATLTIHSLKRNLGFGQGQHVRVAITAKPGHTLG